MLTETIQYEDYNGASRKEQFHFNLSELDITEIQLNYPEGVETHLQNAIDNKDVKGILEFIKMLVGYSFGIKSDDGRHFERSDEITKRFRNSAAYHSWLLTLFENDGAKGVSFIRGVMPAELIKRAEERRREEEANKLNAGVVEQPAQHSAFGQPQPQQAPVDPSLGQQYQHPSYGQPQQGSNLQTPPYQG